MSKKKIVPLGALVRLALVAALYAALTLALQPLSYGALQLRLSEMLVLLCFYRRDYAAALTLGCFIANLFSPFGLYDIVFGTLATAAAFPMFYTKRLWIAASLPVVSNGIIVGLELYLCGEPLWFSVGSVALGELAVMAAGTVLFKCVLERSGIFMRLIGSDRTARKKRIEKASE